MSIFIALPCYSDNIPYDLHSWLSDIRAFCVSEQIPYVENSVRKYPTLSAVRSQLLAEFIDSGMNNMLFIDHDIRGTVEDVIKIMDIPNHVVSGLYADRHNGKPFKNVPNEKKVLACDYIPMGFCKISIKAATDIYYSMQDEFPLQNRVTQTGRLIVNCFAQGMYNNWWHDEDHAFCYHYRTRCNGKIYVDGTVRLIHDGISLSAPE